MLWKLNLTRSFSSVYLRPLMSSWVASQRTQPCLSDVLWTRISWFYVQVDFTAAALIQAALLSPLTASDLLQDHLSLSASEGVVLESRVQKVHHHYSHRHCLQVYSYQLRCWNGVLVIMNHRFTSRGAVSVPDVAFILLIQASNAYASEITIIMILLLTPYHGHCKWYGRALARQPLSQICVAACAADVWFLGSFLSPPPYTRNSLSKLLSFSLL